MKNANFANIRFSTSYHNKAICRRALALCVLFGGRLFLCSIESVRRQVMVNPAPALALFPHSPPCTFSLLARKRFNAFACYNHSFSVQKQRKTSRE